MQQHLITIRRLSIEFLCLWMLFFVLIYLKHELILKQIFQPMGHDIPVLATQILSPLLIPIQLSLDFSFFLCLPFAILQIWRFIRPGLFKMERRFFSLILLLSFSLFLLGLCFCWFWILPFLFSLIKTTLPIGMLWMPSWNSFYEFELMMEGFFGMAFQIPLMMVLFVRLQLINFSQLKKTRPYAIVAAFTIGMLITPPDVGSQILVAIPLCLLYELGMCLSFLGQKK